MFPYYTKYLNNISIVNYEHFGVASRSIIKTFWMLMWTYIFFPHFWTNGQCSHLNTSFVSWENTQIMFYFVRKIFRVCIEVCDLCSNFSFLLCFGMLPHLQMHVKLAYYLLLHFLSAHIHSWKVFVGLWHVIKSNKKKTIFSSFYWFFSVFIGLYPFMNTNVKDKFLTRGQSSLQKELQRDRIDFFYQWV